ncbi:MAG: hypothetical protein AB8B71_03680 [Paracoccaceae bacterium]
MFDHTLRITALTTAIALGLTVIATGSTHVHGVAQASEQLETNRTVSRTATIPKVKDS